MKKKILILFGVFLWNLCIFAKDLNVGIIFDSNSNFSRNTVEVLQKELAKNFSKTGYIPKISKVDYLGKNNLEQALKEMGKNKELDSIFIFSSSKLENYKVLNRNKLYFFPLNFEKSQKVVQIKVVHIDEQTGTVGAEFLFGVLQEESGFSYATCPFDTNQAVAPIDLVHKIAANGGIGVLNEVGVCAIE